MGGLRGRCGRAFMLAAAGCANDDNGGGGGAQSADCSADQFGCLTLASGEPIKIGTLLSITGDNRSLGRRQPARRGAGRRQPGREAGRQARPAHGAQHRAGEHRRDLLEGGRAVRGHQAGGRPQAPFGDRDQLLERRARCGRHHLLQEGHPAHLALQHRPVADRRGPAPALLPADRAQRQDPGCRGRGLRHPEADRPRPPPPSTTRAPTPTAWPRCSARSSRSRAARSPTTRPSSRPTGT